VSRICQPRFVAADLGAYAPTLSAELTPQWEGGAKYRTARTDFFRAGDVACLVDDARGLVEVGRERTEDEDYRPWRRWSIENATIGWSFDGAVVLVDPRGIAFMWCPGAAPERWWAAPGPAAERDVYRVGTDLALVVRWDTRTTALWRTRDERAAWERPAPTTTILPAGDRLILSTPELATACVAIDSGQELWQHPLQLVGIVDDLAWVSGDRRIAGVEIATGRVRHEVPVEIIRDPRGPIGPDGVLHLATGLTYQQLDLRAGGARRCLQTYPYDPVRGGPAEASGLPTADGRFVFFDQKFGLWAIHTDEQRTLEPIWRMPARVQRWTIAHDGVYALDDQRRLHRLGAPVPGAPPPAPRDPAPATIASAEREQDDDTELAEIWRARAALPLEDRRIDAIGRTLGGTLAADTSIDGILCRGGAPVSFWIPDGGLRGATLSEPLTIGALEAPAGSRIETWHVEDPAIGTLVHSVWIALDRVVHGLRLPAGTEVVLDVDGRTVAMAMLAAATVVRGRRVPGGEAIYCHDGEWELESR
jgi:hypothetical protein